jgi:hypothetical protein
MIGSARTWSGALAATTLTLAVNGCCGSLLGGGEAPPPPTTAAPGTPATPAAPGTPATPAAPGTPGTPATPATPAATAAHGTPETLPGSISITMLDTQLFHPDTRRRLMADPRKIGRAHV